MHRSIWGDMYDRTYSISVTWMILRWAEAAVNHGTHEERIGPSKLCERMVGDWKLSHDRVKQ